MKRVHIYNGVRILSVFVLLYLVSPATLDGQPSVVLPDKAQPRQVITSENRADWFKEAKFGMFVHWGLYSILGGSYNGHTLPDTTLKNGKSWYAEWIQQRLEVPADIYQGLAQQFNPVNFNADEWILSAKNAGMKYFVITAKHHDGFALWDSKVSSFDIGNSPCKRDLLGELVKACKKYGLKYGFYYSHWQDWEHPQGATPEWTPWRPDNEFEIYWQQKALPQVAELIKRYDPDLLWFDTWGKNHITDKRRDELIGMIRKMSPKCLINGRINFINPGNDIDFLEMMDNEYPDKILSKPWQTPATINHTWGWHAHDFNWKSSTEMLQYLVSNTSKGGNYLLNIGPKPDGSLPAPVVRRLKEMGAWMQSFGEGIYGAHPYDAPVQKEVALTQKTDKNGHRIIYAYILSPVPGQKVSLPIDSKTISSCTMVETEENLSFTPKGNGIEVLVTKPDLLDNSIRLIRISLK